jgi:hypothetical protein
VIRRQPKSLLALRADLLHPLDFPVHGICISFKHEFCCEVELESIGLIGRLVAIADEVEVEGIAGEGVLGEGLIVFA